MIDMATLRPPYAAVAVCCGLMVLLTSAEDALSQGSPGYRMRPPAAGSPGPPAGPSVRPPRLIGTPPDTRPPGRFRQWFFPLYQYPWYSDYAYDDEYPDDSVNGYPADSAPLYEVDPANYSTEVKPARNIQTLDDPAGVGKLHVSQEASEKLVRLTWVDNGTGATQVAFFLADSARAVQAAQTVRSPPFTWFCELRPGTTFAGMTVVLPGGSLVTQYEAVRR